MKNFFSCVGTPTPSFLSYYDNLKTKKTGEGLFLFLLQARGCMFDLFFFIYIFMGAITIVNNYGGLDDNYI